MAKGNLNNLRTPNTEEARAMQRLSAKKRSENIKKKKMLKELLEMALSENTKTGDRYIDITNALIRQAELGNVKAYETIRDTLGQKPIEEQHIIETKENVYDELTADELRELIKNETKL